MKPPSPLAITVKPKSGRITIDRILLLASAVYFVLSGALWPGQRSYDFVPVYTGVRCMLHGCDPYKIQQLSQEYAESGGTDETFLGGKWSDAEPPVYPPSIFVALAPVGLLPWRTAEVLWFSLIAASVLTALGFVLAECPTSNRWLANAIGSLFLLNSVVLIRNGQPGGLAISLLSIGLVLLWRERHLAWAVCLIAISLAIKPQIGGLLVLYLLIRGARRRPLIVAMAISVVMLVLGGFILQSHALSKHWVADLRESIAESVIPGHVNDPAFPTAGQVNLEAGLAVLFGTANVSKLVTCIGLIVLGAAWLAAWKREDPHQLPLGLLFSALAVFSLLPVYHRHYDTPLLILTIPTIAAVYNIRHRLGAVLAAITVLANTHTQWYANSVLVHHFPQLRISVLNHPALFLLVLREENIVMVILLLCYLVAIFRLTPHGGCVRLEAPRRSGTDGAVPKFAL